MNPIKLENCSIHKISLLETTTLFSNCKKLYLSIGLTILLVKVPNLCRRNTKDGVRCFNRYKKLHIWSCKHIYVLNLSRYNVLIICYLAHGAVLMSLYSPKMSQRVTTACILRAYTTIGTADNAQTLNYFMFPTHILAQLSIV